MRRNQRLARSDLGLFGVGFAFLGSHLVLVALSSPFCSSPDSVTLTSSSAMDRILLAGFWATLAAFTATSASVMHVAQHASSPAAAHVFIVILLANFFLLSFTYIDERLTTAATRWLFREPDYRAALRQLAAALRAGRCEAGVGTALEEAVRGPLELNGARWLTIDDASFPAALLEGEIVELEDAEVLVPVAPAGCHLFHRARFRRPALVM